MRNSVIIDIVVKAFAAVIFALLVTGGIVFLTDGFFGKKDFAGRGYSIDIAATPPASPNAASSSAGAVAASDKPVDIMPYLQKADLKLGEQLIKRCQACHSFEKGKPNGVGPNQYGLVGRKVAAVAGFDYSDAMKAKGGTWDFQSLSTFLTEPAKVVVGTKMGFAGLKRPEERAAVIAYINATFSDKPLDLKAK